MVRIPKTNRVARTRAHNTWTEAAFFAFLRSGLRQLSMRWPPLRIAKIIARRPYKGPNKRQKWEYQCSWCEQWFKEQEVQVDHIEPCGSLKSIEDIAPFVKRLFCEVEGLQVLCHSCHNWKK